MARGSIKLTNNGNNNPAAQILLSDLIENILRYSDNPGTCAEYVTTQVRELIGVRIVALVSSEAGISHDLVGICPPRKREQWNQQAIQCFVKSASEYDSPRLIDPTNDPAGKSLSSIGIGTSFVIPLSVGVERVGMLVLFDLLDQKGASVILETLIRVSRVLALILKNSFLYQNLEKTVATRTEQLRLLNEELEQRVKQRTAELEKKNLELAHFNKLFVGRELRMVELKKRIEELEEKLGG
jgi:transcriptional regulator with GAF, ATPase, and Fis domain